MGGGGVFHNYFSRHLILVYYKVHRMAHLSVLIFFSSKSYSIYSPQFSTQARKLEFLLADAINQGCTSVITCGSSQSNHCRATAIATRQLGLEPYLLLRSPVSVSSNALNVLWINCTSFFKLTFIPMWSGSLPSWWQGKSLFSFYNGTRLIFPASLSLSYI